MKRQKFFPKPREINKNDPPIVRILKKRYNERLKEEPEFSSFAHKLRYKR